MVQSNSLLGAINEAFLVYLEVQQQLQVFLTT